MPTQTKLRILRNWPLSLPKQKFCNYSLNDFQWNLIIDSRRIVNIGFIFFIYYNAIILDFLKFLSNTIDFFTMAEFLHGSKDLDVNSLVVKCYLSLSLNNRAFKVAKWNCIEFRSQSRECDRTDFVIGCAFSIAPPTENSMQFHCRFQL